MPCNSFSASSPATRTTPRSASRANFAPVDRSVIWAREWTRLGSASALPHQRGKRTQRNRQAQRQHRMLSGLLATQSARRSPRAETASRFCRLRPGRASRARRIRTAAIASSRQVSPAPALRPARQRPFRAPAATDAPPAPSCRSRRAQRDRRRGRSACGSIPTMPRVRSTSASLVPWMRYSELPR